MSSLDEWRSEAYENAKLFKEKVKRWHDGTIINIEFNIGDKVLLYRSCLSFLQANYFPNGKDLILLKKYIAREPLR